MEIVIKRATNPAVKCYSILPPEASQAMRNKLAVDMVACSDSFVNLLQVDGRKLRADNSTDTVHGYVNISHGIDEHIITVVLYDADELPNEIHYSTLKKPTVVPTKAELEALIP